MNKISERQLFFFLACVAPVGKLVILPARLAGSNGNDLWLPAAVHFVLEAATVFCVLLLCRRGEDLFDLLKAHFGKTVSKILMTVLALFLVFAGVLPMLEQKLFVQGVFYDTLPSLVAFAPFFLFSAYLCAKPLATFGRVFDLLAPIAIVGYFGIVLFSAGSSDFAAMLPVGSSGGKKLLSGAAEAFPWFFDTALLLAMAGKIEARKGTAWKGALCYLAGGTAVVFFLLLFYGIFEGTALNQLFAFTKTSKYFSGITVLGRVDYLFIFALSLVMVFYTALPVSCAVDCAMQAYGERKYLPVVLSILINVCYFLCMWLLDFRFGETMRAISKAGMYIFPLFTLVLPVLSPLLGRRHRERA